MSQSSRSHALAPVRWREQVARLIALADPNGCEWCRGSRVDGAGRCPACSGHFDVALARGYAHRLIAVGERLEVEREVFADWTRERGLGPENRAPGAFGDGECGHCLGSGNEGHGRQGNRWFTGGPCRPCNGTGHVKAGWPGPLASEWGWEKCKACEGKGRVAVKPDDCERCEATGRVTRYHDRGAPPLELPGPGLGIVLDCLDCWGSGEGRRSPPVKCETCRGRGRILRHGRDARAANGGAALIRQGRRLLAALEGQPSECQHPRCVSAFYRPTCPSCRGTGHNLAGVLPPVEDNDATIMAVADALRSIAWRDEVDNVGDAVLALAQWQRDVYERSTDRIEARLAKRTRIVPRGEHRSLEEARPYGVLAWRGDEPTEGTARAVAHALDRDPDEMFAEMQARYTLGMKHLPRWRRGELLHAEQRRDRERQRRIADNFAATVGVTRLPGESQREFAERLLGFVRDPVAPQDSGPSVPG